MAEQHAEDDGANEKWRQIVNAIQGETDAGKLSKLVKELCAEIDLQKTFPTSAVSQLSPETLSEHGEKWRSSSKEGNEQVAGAKRGTAAE